MTIDDVLARVADAEAEWAEAEKRHAKAEAQRYAAWKRAHKAGASYAQIAAVVGCHRTLISYRIGGEG